MILRTKLTVLVAALVSASFAGCMGGNAEGDGTPIAVLKTTARDDGVTFLFDATNSTDPDGSASDLIVEWNFGDEGVQTGPLLEFGLIEYTYAVTDTTFLVSLVVRDQDGKASFQLEPVTLGSGVNTGAVISLKNTTRWVQPDAGVVLDASRTTDPDGDAFSYEWIVGEFSTTPPSVGNGTEYLPMGGVANLTFDRPGVYLFHCHPHPWMKGRVIVSEDDANATSAAQIDIANFAYSQKTLVVSPGATVQYRNLDPTEHTATLEWFAPGKVESTSPVLSKKLAAGDHIARLFTNDGKGGYSTMTWGLRATAEAPVNPLQTDMSNAEVRYVDGAPTGNQPSTMPQIKHEYETLWIQNLTVSISWNTQQSALPTSGAAFWNIYLEDKDANRIAGGFCEEGTCSFVLNIVPGKYTMVAEAQDNFVGSINWTAVATQYAYPGFGDSILCPPGTHSHGGICMTN
jgi:plastocyanin